MGLGVRYFTLGQARVALKHVRVLVAEDDDDIRQLLGLILRADGFEITEARNGEELLAQLRRDDAGVDDRSLPDVIVSDIMMPQVTGLDALAWMRRAGVDVPVILVTAYGDPATLKEAERLGATAVFHKPLDLDDLRTAILHYGSR